MVDVHAVSAAIRNHRFRYSSEDRLQEGIALALTSRGYSVQREVRLDSHCRIDLVVARIGIEVKIAGTAADVHRQIARYLRSDQLDALVLVTSRVRHLHIPESINGKQVEVITLAWAGL
jgi:hypothetical protein